MPPKLPNFLKLACLGLALAAGMRFPDALANQWPNPSANLLLTAGETKLVLPAALINSWQAQAEPPLPAGDLPQGDKNPAAGQGDFRLAMEVPIKKVALPLNAIVGEYAGRSYQTFSQSARTYHFNPNLVYAWLKTEVLPLRQKPVEPKLIFADSRVREFQPPQAGQEPDLYASSLAVLTALENRRASAFLIMDLVAPKNTLAQTNNLGIQELVARGESNFAGSPKNRIHNILVGVEKQKGVIVPPGEEFSFNRHLGPVEASAGFLPELVIKRTGTVPEFGGGLCQVSSTTFRAAVNAGLPITQRKNHSYAVQYYAPQGTDATIYPGVIDLKFLNDTPGAILIWPYIKNQTTLVFDFYGTKDTRQIIVDKPAQYDKRPDGAMKAVWTREVTKDGQTRSDIFKSVYLPPALFHKQEEFVPQAPPQPAENSKLLTN